MNFNIQGLSDKGHQLEATLSEEEVDVLCLSEHWVRDNMDGFNLGDHKVVSSFCRSKYRCGGVAIFAKRDYDCVPVRLRESVEKSCEVCCVKLVLDGVVLFILCTYRSPTEDFELFVEVTRRNLDTIFKPGANYIICGDMNVDILNPNKSTANRSNVERLTNLMGEYGLTYTILEPTRVSRGRGSCLDQVYTNLEPSCVNVVSTSLSDHTYQVVSFRHLLSAGRVEGDRIGRVFSLRNRTKFAERLGQVDWELVDHNYYDFDLAFELFYKTVLDVFHTCFPLEKIKSKRVGFQMPQNVREIGKLLGEMARLVRETNNPVLVGRYRVLRAWYGDKIRELRRSYNDTRIITAGNATKESWKIAREISNNNVGLNLIIDKYGSKSDLANKFNNYFGDVIANMGTYGPQNNVNILNRSIASLFLTPTDPQEIKCIMREIGKKKIMGHR